MVSLEARASIYSSAQRDTQAAIGEEGWRASGNDQNFGNFFSRDSAICGLFRLHRVHNYLKQTEINSSGPDFLDHPDFKPVRDSLRTMARYQGTTVDLSRDERRGKIPHELRFWDTDKNISRLQQLANSRWPVDENGLRYYGAVDPTMLFVKDVCEYYLVSSDLAFFMELEPNLDSALSWIKKDGDSYGDGYIRYSADNRFALLNQGWKDSLDSIEVLKNERPREPIALVEVQGYTYMAYLSAAEAYRKRGSVGDVEKAKELYQRAGALKVAFNRDFWAESKGFFAYALDGNNHQVNEITSNAGHLLMSGIVDDDKLPQVVSRLLESDMFTNGGIRTLSSNSEFFTQEHPAGYHRGTIWTHDNALIYLGLLSSGFLKEAILVRDTIMEAQLVLCEKYGVINAELHCCDENGNVIPYVQAQRPQTWVGEANLMMLDELEMQRLDSV